MYLTYCQVALSGTGETSIACAIQSTVPGDCSEGGALACVGGSEAALPPSSASDTPLVAVAVSQRHGCGLRLTGRIICWGEAVDGMPGE